MTLPVRYHLERVIAVSGKDPHGKNSVPPEPLKPAVEQAASRDGAVTLPRAPATPPVSDPDEAEAEPIDLSDVLVLRRNWKEPGLVLRFDEYTAEATVATVEPYMNLAVAVGTGSPKAEYTNVHILKDGSGDIALVPSAKKVANSLEVTWSKGGDTFRVDLAPFLTVRPFAMPEATRAYLPAEFKSLRGVGACMVLHFSQAEFARIEKGAPRKKKNPEQPAASDKQ